MIRKFTKIGRYHSETGEENQDAMWLRSNREFNVISLADGVSGCRKAKSGAEIACRAVADLYFDKGEYFLDFDEQTTVNLTLSHVLYTLEQAAEKEHQEIDDYSSTIACVLFDKRRERLLFFNLGDSMIIGVSDKHCRILAHPYDSVNGYCCVTTTKHAQDMSEVKILDAETMNLILICSDGAWREMFVGGHLKRDMKDLLLNEPFSHLELYFTQRECFDDCSFILMYLWGEMI